MPHATVRYPFEIRLLDFAREFEARTIGAKNNGFCLRFDPDGRVVRVHATPDRSWTRMMIEFDESDASYLVYDPFDPPEYFFLKWQDVSRSTIDQLLGTPLADADFVPLGGSSARWLPPGGWPESWDVMF